MWRVVVVTGLVAAMAACSMAPETSPSESAPPTTEVVETVPPTTIEDVAALCNGYLVLLRSGDDGPLRQALQDPASIEALDVMLSSEGEFEAIARAALDLEQKILEDCSQRFSLGTEPATGDAAALETFIDALLMGDQEAAELVAWDNVVAQFEPWSPIEDSGDEVTYDLDRSTATVRLGPNLTVTCTAEQGLVVSCRYQG